MIFLHGVRSPKSGNGKFIMNRDRNNRLTTTAHELDPLFSSVKLARSRSFLPPRWEERNTAFYKQSNETVLHVCDQICHFYSLEICLSVKR